MSYNGAGVFQLAAGNPVVTGTTISSTWANNTLSDIANNGLTNCITKDGQQTVTANIPFNNNRLTSVGNGVAASDAATVGQIQSGAATSLVSVSGTDTITANSAPVTTAYAAGQTFTFVAAGTNTTNAVTLNLNALGAKNITKFGTNPLNPGDIINGAEIVVMYDGTQFQWINPFPFAVSPSFRNQVGNGNFDVWQRGTSFSTGNTYTADLWKQASTGSNSVTSLQAFALGQSNVPNNPIFFARNVVTSAAGAGNFCSFAQPIEGVGTFSGQYATLSFWAKADASRNIAVELFQSFGTGGSPSAAVTGIGVKTCALTTSWQKFTNTVLIPSVAGKTLGTNGNDALNINFWFDSGSNFSGRNNSLGQQSGTFDISQVQLEAGTFALPFEVRDPQAELSRCMRYFEAINFTGGQIIAVGQAVSSAITDGAIYYKVRKRSSAQAVGSSGTIVAWTAGATSAGGTFAIGTRSVDSALIQITGATGLVAGNASSFVASTNSVLTIDASI